MNMHNLLHQTLSGAWRTKARFFSIFGIIAVSSGFYAGLKASGPDLKQSAEQYYCDTNLMDLHLLSSQGFCADELSALAARDDIAQICGGYSETLLFKGSDDAAVQVCSLLTDGGKDAKPINQPVLTEGRMPEAPDECLIEAQTPAGIQVGDTVTLTVPSGEESALRQMTFTAVGRADSPLFTGKGRGTTSVGSGRIGSFLLVPPEAFQSEIYTDIYLKLSAAEGLDSYSQHYLTVVSDAADDILADAKELSEPRRQQILEAASQRLEKNRRQLDADTAAYEASCQELEDTVKQEHETVQQAREKLESSRTGLDKGWTAYHEKIDKYNAELDTLIQKQNVIDAKQKLKSGRLDELKQKIERIEYAVNVIAGSRNACIMQPFPKDIQALIDEMSAYNTEDYFVSEAMNEFFSAPVHTDQKENLEQTITFFLNNCKASMQNESAQITADSKKFSVSRRTIRKSVADLEKQKTQLDKDADKLNSKEAAYAASLQKLDEQDAAIDIKDAEEHGKLAETKQKLDERETEYQNDADAVSAVANGIQWEAHDRRDQPDWVSFGTDADRTARIAKIFPAFFLLTALLICFTAMSRAVTEQQDAIRSRRASGTSAGAIIRQSLLCAAFISVTGAAAGTVIGCQAIPRIVSACFRTIYHYPQINCPFYANYALICLGTALLCTGSAAIAACCNILRSPQAAQCPPSRSDADRHAPAKLLCEMQMRLAACLRKSGILTAAVGICGCTALLVTGFGLHHSIAAITDLQFGEIQTYDAVGFYDASAAQRTAIRDTLEHTPEIAGWQFGMLRTATIRANHRSYEISMIVPEHPETFPEFIVTRDRLTHEARTLSDEGVMINEKLAKLLNVQTGDTVSFAEGMQPVPVTAIVENYAQNRVILTKSCCKKLYGKYQENCVFINETPGTDEAALAEHLLHSAEFKNLQFSSQNQDHFRSIGRILSYVTAILILFSGLLAFAVLYHLANSLIPARMQTISAQNMTEFRAGGFFARTLPAAVCGILTGSFAGAALCRYVVQAAEADPFMLIPDIPWYCFALAACITLAFMVPANLLIRRKAHLPQAASAAE